MESFLPQESVEIRLLQRVSFGRLPVITRTLLLAWACGLGEKLIMVNSKINLQSLIEFKVLSTKGLLFKTKTKTIDASENVSRTTFAQFTGSSPKAKQVIW